MEQNRELKDLCWEIRASLDKLYENLSVVEVGGLGWKTCAAKARGCTLSMRNYFKEFRKLSTRIAEETTISRDALKTLRDRC